MTKGGNTRPLDAGVGTGDWFDWLGGGSSGVGVSRNIRNAYAFLVNNYQAAAAGQPYTDEIFIFGFSRGAFTARAINALVGTIKNHNDNRHGQFHGGVRFVSPAQGAMRSR
jgi:uncharacterized protein (DUF2235 family)